MRSVIIMLARFLVVVGSTLVWKFRSLGFDPINRIKFQIQKLFTQNRSKAIAISLEDEKRLRLKLDLNRMTV